MVFDIACVMLNRCFRGRSIFKCQVGSAKSRGGGHVNFHVASRGVAINFHFPAGVVMFKVSNTIIKKKFLAYSCFIN